MSLLDVPGQEPRTMSYANSSSINIDRCRNNEEKDELFHMCSTDIYTAVVRTNAGIWVTLTPYSYEYYSMFKIVLRNLYEYLSFFVVVVQLMYVRFVRDRWMGAAVVYGLWWVRLRGLWSGVLLSTAVWPIGTKKFSILYETGNWV